MKKNCKKMFIYRMLFAFIETIISAILLYLFIVSFGEFLNGDSFMAFLYFVGTVISAVFAYYIFMIGLYEAAKEKGNITLAKRIRRLM